MYTAVIKWLYFVRETSFSYILSMMQFYIFQAHLWSEDFKFFDLTDRQYPVLASINQGLIFAMIIFCLSEEGANLIDMPFVVWDDMKKYYKTFR